MRISASIFSLTLLLLGSSSHAIEFNARSAPELDALFQTTNGWLGADGAYSIPLSRNKSLWLFSDTWVGRVQDGSRIEPKMINNSIAIQQHGKPPEFFYPTNSNGAAQSFIKPQDGRGYFWLFAGTRTPQGVYFFLRHVETVNSNSVFGFRGFGTSLAHVSNPDDAPARWRIQQIRFPFDQREDKEQVVLGSAVMKDKGFVYVYGNSSVTNRKGLIVARVPERKFASFTDWQFFSDGRWTADFSSMTPICQDAPSEGSVIYWPAIKKYAFVYTLGLWGKASLRTADQPTGPWSEPVPLYDCPEMTYSKKVFCYAGKAHPQLSSKRDELILSYAANSFDIFEVIKDARLYWPRFVRVNASRD